MNEKVKIKIHEKQVIKPCNCNNKGDDDNDNDDDDDDNVKVIKGGPSDSDINLKEKVFVNRAKPLYVSGKSRHVVIPASKPIIVKPSPVVIRQKGDVEVRPIHITKQLPPLIVTKKIVKLHQPIIKKYYVEKYRRQEGGQPGYIVSQKVSKQTCDCPISEHVIPLKY